MHFILPSFNKNCWSLVFKNAHNLPKKTFTTNQISIRTSGRAKSSYWISVRTTKLTSGKNYAIIPLHGPPIVTFSVFNLEKNFLDVIEVEFDFRKVHINVRRKPKM